MDVYQQEIRRIVDVDGGDRSGTICSKEVVAKPFEFALIGGHAKLPTLTQ